MHGWRGEVGREFGAEGAVGHQPNALGTIPVKIPSAVGAEAVPLPAPLRILFLRRARDLKHALKPRALP